MTLFFYLFLFVFLFVCMLLSGAVLVQEAKSMGLGASFGGDAGDSLFGTSTAEVLKRITAYLAAAFLIGCLVLSLWCASMGRSSGITPTGAPLPIEEEG